MSPIAPRYRSSPASLCTGTRVRLNCRARHHAVGDLESLLDTQLVEQRDRVLVEPLGPEQIRARLRRAETVVRLPAVVVADAAVVTAQRPPWARRTTPCS